MTAKNAPATNDPAKNDAARAGDATGPARRPRRRWRWVRRALVLVVVLALIARALLPTIVESAARSWAEGQGLDLRFEEIDFALSSGRVALWGVELSKDGDRALRVETVDLDLDVSALVSGALVVRRAEIDGVDARLERGPDGGLTLFDGAPRKDPQDADEDEAEETTERAPLDSLALPFAVHAARVQRVSLEWKDAAADPPVELDAELDLAISDLGTGAGPARARLRFAAPGAIERIALDATLTTTETALAGELRLDLSGVHGGAARAYLADIGLEPPARAQDLRIEALADLALEGPDALAGSVELRQSVGRGSGTPRNGANAEVRAPDTWLELASVRANFTPDARGTAIEVQTVGLALEAERAADGRFVLAGFVLGGGEASDDASATDAGDPASGDAADDASDDATASGPSPIRLVRVAVTGAELALVDRAIAADGLRTGLAIDALELDLEAEGGTTASLTARAPGVFESARVEARFGASDGDADDGDAGDGYAGGSGATATITGLTLERLRPYLAAADLEPSGASCELSLVVERLAIGGAAITRLTELTLVDGPRTALEVSQFEFEDEDGVLGVKLQGLVARLASEAPGRATLGPLRIGRTPANAEDGSQPEVIDAELRLDARVVGLDTRGDGAPASVFATLTAPGLVDSVELEGVVGMPEEGATLEALVSVAGLRETALADLRPAPEEEGLSAKAGLTFSSVRGADGSERVSAAIESFDLDGRIAARALSFDGTLRRASGTQLEGTLRAEDLSAEALELSNGTFGADLVVASGDDGTRLTVADLVLGDGDTSLRAPTIEFDARTDADGGTTIETAVVRGLEIDARRRADGALVVAGAVVVPARDAATDDTSPAPDAVATTPTDGSETGTDADTTGDAPPGAPEAGRLALGTLVVEVSRFEIVDEATGDRTRASLRLVSDAPAVLFDPEGETTPLSLRLEGALEPGVERVALELTATPDEGGVELTATLAVEGVSDRGLVRAWPDLGATLAEGGVEDGRLNLSLDARIDAPRTSAVAFDLRRLVDATLEVRDAAFVPRPDAEPGFALESARVQLRSLGGDGVPLRLGEVEVVNARVEIEELADATSIAGLRLRRADDGADADADADGSAESNDDATPSEDSADDGSRSAPSGPGVAIDHLAWTGLDLAYTDRRHDPPTRLPIDTLDLDARNLVLGGPLRRPVQFRASVRGAAVDLPEQPEETDILSSLARELTGSGERKRSERRWLDELVVAGNIAPGQTLEGWVRTELYGFELLALESLAGDNGVEIGGGVVDSDVRVDLRGNDGQRIKSRTTFTTLSVKEPANGPISRFLRLPAPLDVVLWVLRNERGEQVVPLSFTIDDSGVSTTELVRQGTQALVLLITDALAASPLRLGGGLLDIVGFDPFGGDDEVEGAGDPVTLAFDAGATRLDDAAQTALTDVLRVLAADDTVVYRVGHVFSPTDLERARAFAVPDPAASADLASRLEVERDEIVARLAYGRERLARLVATGADTESLALADELRGEAAELDELERTLDTLYALSVPADERTREKRLRAAAQRLAERRFESVVRELFARDAGKSLERLQFVRPRTSDLDESEDARGRLVFTPRGR